MKNSKRIVENPKKPTRITVSLPDEVGKKLAESAHFNRRSMSAEAGMLLEKAINPLVQDGFLASMGAQ